MKEIDCEKLENLSMLIHDTACVKVWHDAPKSEPKVRRLQFRPQDAMLFRKRGRNKRK